jgi:hypothetical protein
MQVIIRKVSYYVVFCKAMQVIIRQGGTSRHLQGCTQFTNYHP